VLNNLLLQYRRPLIILTHGIIFTVSYALAFALRFDFSIPISHFSLLIISLPMVLLAKLVIFEFFDLYQGWWRYSSMKDLIHIVQASVISALAVMATGHLLFFRMGFPRSISIIDFFMTVGLVGGSRFVVRAVRERQVQGFFLAPKIIGEAVRVLIIGAGDAGETLVRELQKHPEMNHEVVGFLDDSPYKQKTRLHGYPVLGLIEEVKKFSELYQVNEIFIAMPAATGNQMKRVVSLCEGTGCKIKTIPGIDRLIDGRVTVSMLRQVEIEDLLGRAPVVLDKTAIGLYLNGKKVLVTGAAGSIGSEICRQLLEYNPAELILVDQWENGIFEMGRELKTRYQAGAISYFIGDIRDRERMRAIFCEKRPDVVFHAAAYKHVPLMEENPGEAIKNNVLGTKLLCDLCEELGCVDRFVMISTDKAVHPASVMGASKRIAGRYVQYLARTARAKFITVRFGNVLGSAGSVIPIFKKQIASGGPVTVTHPDMMRYFMTIPEASQLVLQAGAMGRGGEIFVLDMGEPVHILDLATSLIKLSGLRPHDDIKIEFTGIRPGEKLFEELRLDSEEMLVTTHPKVFVHTAADSYPRDFSAKIETIIGIADTASLQEIKEKISELVPEYIGTSYIARNVIQFDPKAEIKLVSAPAKESKSTEGKSEN
jgi:FlaA1/EpsC-like NDP-sugar epimerase